MNYESAISKLTGRNREWRKLGNNTYLLRDADGSTLHVRLHNTNIMTFRPDGSVTLHSGGWRTVTTKARMNEYLSGWGISQERGQWYVTRQNPKYKGWEETPDEPFWERVCLFAEGITLRPDGTVEGGEPLENEKKNLTLRRRVHAFTEADRQHYFVTDTC